MKFVVRSGDVEVAVADPTMLRALGLPAGGIVTLGSTHVLVKPGEVASPSYLMVGARDLANSGLGVGSPVDIKRKVLGPAERLVVDDLPPDLHGVLHALHGRPATAGDSLKVHGAYLQGGEDVNLRVLEVVPDGVGLIGAQTLVTTERSTTSVRVGSPSISGAPVVGGPAKPSMATALLAGLENEVDLLTGWFSLLAGPTDLAGSWGLPEVAGVLLAGPNGCGKSELVAAAAARAGCKVVEIDLTLVFKAESLLDKLSAAIESADGPTVIHVDRLEAITGDGTLITFRTQAAAILRWFLDAVADKPRLACVLGVTSLGQLHTSVVTSPLLPRSITIPPPDVDRRRLLFEAATARLPTDELDSARLAAASSGFSGADIMASVVQASTVIARAGGRLSTELILESIRVVTPSLGSVPVGEMTSFGFDKVANLEDVKQRLTEAVIWPVANPDRFVQLGIEPPKGVLLYGPPGTGKTFVVKALAHEAGAAFFSVKGAELLDKYVGESERGVREVFARARAAAPSIIFFDEFDALAPVRGRSSSTVSDSVVAALLTELDGVSDRGQVAVIAATNRPDLIDPALRRAGRFEVHIELGLPPAESRRKMLDLSDVPLAEDVDLDELARRCEGLSFADMAGLLREAALDTLRGDHGAMTVGWPQLESALARFQNRVDD
ncbi:MAG: ATP-binding protein [Acidimicrobiales bacterium]|nr:ATP-binding protein [Acidimicrobiales bacterium]